jgi:hypothetical protein
MMLQPPRKPLSAYNFFFQDERAKLLGSQAISEEHEDPRERKKRRHRKTHGKIGFTQLAKHVGQLWKNLDAGTRKSYAVKYQADKKRHAAELADYEEQLSNMVHLAQVKKALNTLKAQQAERRNRNTEYRIDAVEEATLLELQKSSRKRKAALEQGQPEHLNSKQELGAPLEANLGMGCFNHGVNEGDGTRKREDTVLEGSFESILSKAIHMTNFPLEAFVGSSSDVTMTTTQKRCKSDTDFCFGDTDVDVAHNNVDSSQGSARQQARVQAQAHKEAWIDEQQRSSMFGASVVPSSHDMPNKSVNMTTSHNTMSKNVNVKETDVHAQLGQDQVLEQKLQMKTKEMDALDCCSSISITRSSLFAMSQGPGQTHLLTNTNMPMPSSFLSRTTAMNHLALMGRRTASTRRLLAKSMGIAMGMGTGMGANMGANMGMGFQNPLIKMNMEHQTKINANNGNGIVNMTTSMNTKTKNYNGGLDMVGSSDVLTPCATATSSSSSFAPPQQTKCSSNNKASKSKSGSNKQQKQNSKKKTANQQKQHVVVEQEPAAGKSNPSADVEDAADDGGRTADMLACIVKQQTELDELKEQLMGHMGTTTSASTKKKKNKKTPSKQVNNSVGSVVIPETSPRLTKMELQHDVQMKKVQVQGGVGVGLSMHTWPDLEDVQGDNDTGRHKRNHTEAEIDDDFQTMLQRMTDPEEDDNVNVNADANESENKESSRYSSSSQQSQPCAVTHGAVAEDVFGFFCMTLGDEGDGMDSPEHGNIVDNEWGRGAKDNDEEDDFLCPLSYVGDHSTGEQSVTQEESLHFLREYIYD